MAKAKKPEAAGADGELNVLSCMNCISVLHTVA